MSSQLSPIIIRVPCFPVLLLLTLMVSGVAEEFDMGRSFSTNANPSEVWTYGYTDAPGGIVNLLSSGVVARTDDGKPLHIWRRPDASYPVIGNNLSDETGSSLGGQFLLPPRAVWMSPGAVGSEGAFGVIRFHVPSGGDGDYDVSVQASSLLLGAASASSELRVLVNSSLLHSTVVPPESSSSATEFVRLVAGDTIDFLVGRDPDNPDPDGGLILSATISQRGCSPLPEGLRGWWSLNGLVRDLTTQIDALSARTPINYTNGLVNGAVYFDGSRDWLTVPASSALDVGAGDGMTFECWLRPDSGNTAFLFSWGEPFAPGFTVSMLGARSQLSAELVDVDGTRLSLRSEFSEDLLVRNVIKHVALTYDKESGVGRIYLNGIVVAEGVSPGLVLDTSHPLSIGGRPGQALFRGWLDEVSVYGRALTESEITEIVAASSDGKCGILGEPEFLVQPLDFAGKVDESYEFSVTAAGAPLISFQWLFNGIPIAGETNRNLLLEYVDLDAAGAYSVLASNSFGVVPSRSANLTLQARECVAIDPSLAAWWRMDGNADDVVSLEPGTLLNGVASVDGLVGAALKISPTNYVFTSAGELDIGSGESFTLEGWVKPESAVGLGRIANFENTSTSPVVGLSISGSRRLEGLVSDGRFGGSAVSVSGLMQSGVFHHVALTYHKPTGTIRIFHNGVEVGTRLIDPVEPLTRSRLVFGRSSSLTVDEWTLHRVALEPEALLAIATSKSSGRCDSSSPPVIERQPMHQSVVDGQFVQFEPLVLALPPITYQWFFDGAPVPGATQQSLTFPSIGLTNSGTYVLEAANRYGSTTSSNARLSVYLIDCGFAGAADPRCDSEGPPRFIVEPEGDSLLEGGGLTLVAAVTGAEPLSYQWTLNGEDLPGATNHLFLVPHAGLSDAGVYRLNVTNAAGSASSQSVVVSVRSGGCVELEGAVAWWKFDSDLSETFSGSTGLVAGSPFVTDGLVNGAIRFKGLFDRIELAPVNLDASEGFTLETWFAPDALDFDTIVIEWNDIGSGSPTPLGVRLATGSNGSLKADLWDTAEQNHPLESDAGLLVAGAFQHVAITYDRITGKGYLYHNGDLVDEVSPGVVDLKTDSLLYFGGSPSVPQFDSKYVGLLDEVGIYRRALSQQEIDRIFVARMFGKCSELPRATISTIQVRDGMIFLEFDSVEGINYVVEKTEDLSSGRWNIVGSVIPGTGNTVTWSSSLFSGQTKCFLRVGSNR